VTLAQDAGYLPATTPPTNVAIGAVYTTPTDGLTIDGVIGQPVGLGTGLTKVGTGAVILTNSGNSTPGTGYSGTTIVAAGSLRVNRDGPLGTRGPPLGDGTIAQSGAALELDGSATALSVTGEGLFLNGVGTPAVQSITVAGPTTGTFTLTFNGQTTGN